MIDKNFIQKIKREYDQNESERRQIISLSNNVLHTSKRVIFSLHRKDIEKAESGIKEVESILQDLENKFGYNRILEEGAYKAAAEEYVEAKVFFSVLKGNNIDEVKEVKIKFDSYLGGICDLTGELVRLAINEAANGNYKRVEEIKAAVDEIMAELIEFDMSGYLRTKYDQAKASHRKIEQINYEVNLKK